MLLDVVAVIFLSLMYLTGKTNVLSKGDQQRKCKCMCHEIHLSRLRGLTQNLFHGIAHLILNPFS